MPHATDETENSTNASSGPRRIILCFDGTGNHFQGNESDTNIVKIYQMLDRHKEGQFHYYQPGIGTYIKGQGNSATRGKILPKVKSSIINTVDQAVGTSFQQHVLAGYHFVMRYYQPGDHIYIFGFSRGAYTARFLAEMIHDLGLLSKGNEEMVQFAWDTFSDFQQSRGNDPQTEKDDKLKAYMLNFNKTFAGQIVGQFEIPLFRKSYKVIANPPARYIRHAVAIHERRLKFKPALFHIDPNGPPVDLKEVWFAGNHCDIGGGYGLEKGQKHLLSDSVLNWMLQEVLNLEGSESKLQFQTLNVDDVSKAENAFPGKEEPGTDAFSLRRKTNQPHDTLRFGHGTPFIMVLLWWILEILPIFTRLELENGKWIPRRLPPNLGAPRDLPSDAVIDPSVKEMIQAGILDKESIPPRGGDNPNLPNVANITYTWSKLRNRLSNQASNASKDSAADDTKSALRNAMPVPAKTTR
ncbi:uncharacterized protein N7458_008738 [Penicillium daleae]|uniref:T6SS Phospholipase effector Tle1-like catalytic domain-containing protein n=1 Tax=Penicillium daleae TaxID=63821 RepID=A0AAD6FXQ7_9EURO|nr:uncharacterized protein N7458_008738 [Penicillium daleae]KAJ5437740.1 hypothetical protein N7458_008738 [Penicillium daleae]